MLVTSLITGSVMVDAGAVKQIGSKERKIDIFLHIFGDEKKLSDK